MSELLESVKEELGAVEVAREPAEPEAANEINETELIEPTSTSEVATVDAEERAFVLSQRKAKMMASSTLVPKEYQGADKIANIMIAMNMARRMNADPLQVMQNLHVIHGRPGWSAQFLIATFNACGRFSAIKYRFNKEKTECTAVTTEKATGELLEGSTVSLEMAKAEGWSTKTGSKWKTMPEQMLRYRAATFLIRAVAPEIGLGLYTQDELQDVGDR